MARIRTIKPAHWNDKELAKIPLQAHLLWIALWNFSDDEGVFEDDAILIKSQVFPRRTDIRTEQIEDWLARLKQARFIIPFTHNKIGYYIHRTFKSHQKIDKPQPSKIPSNIIRGIIGEHSTNHSGTVAPDSIVEDSKSIVVCSNTQINSSNQKRKTTTEKGMLAGDKIDPPDYSEVKRYFFDKLKGTSSKLEPGVISQKFFNNYDSTKAADGSWRTARGQLITDWKAKANQWLLGDMNGVNNNSSNQYNVKLKPKEVGFIESLYTEWLEGSLKEDSLPVHVYKFLEEKKIICYSVKEKEKIYNDADQDEVLAQKKALAMYFDKLRSEGIKTIFQQK